MEAIKGGRTLSDLARQVDVHPTLITQWRAQLMEGASGVFGAAAAAAPAVDAEIPHAKIGEPTLADDVLEGGLGKAGLRPSARR